MGHEKKKRATYTLSEKALAQRRSTAGWWAKDERYSGAWSCIRVRKEHAEELKRRFGVAAKAIAYLLSVCPKDKEKVFKSRVLDAETETTIDKE